MKRKSICLVVVNGGVAECYHNDDVECLLIDFDNINAGEDYPEVPRGIGFEALMEKAGLDPQYGILP